MPAQGVLPRLVLPAGVSYAAATSEAALRLEDKDGNKLHELRGDGIETISSGTATATSGAATLNKRSGKITSEALTTAAAAAYTLTLTNSAIAATDIVLVSVANGTNTQGIVVPGRVTPGNGSVVILIENQHASQALNGTLVISFVAFKAGS